MILIFDIPSSILFWRNVYRIDKAPTSPDAELPDECFATKRCDILRLLNQVRFCEALAVDGAWHFLTLSESDRRESRDYQFKVWKGDLPFGSLYQLCEGVYVESPGFMFLRAANSLDLPQLIAFGDELCGTYSFSPAEKRGFRKRLVPLSSKSQLEHFVSSVGNHHGIKKARRALPFVVNNSASPMETFDEMTMCLPYHFGGYGLPMPVMNREITLTPEARLIAKRSRCFLDMSWDGFPLDVEHHGKLDHSSYEDHLSDRARVIALKIMKYEVIELTNNQVDDLLAYEQIIISLAKRLGKRIDNSSKGPTPERTRLRNALRVWNSSYGSVL